VSCGGSEPENGYVGDHQVYPREDVQFMNTMRKAALTLAATVLGVGALGISAPAHADTNWPCAACFTGGR
jgi:hypothetical protein